MQRFINQYLNEIVSLTMMGLMIVALIHTEAQAGKAAASHVDERPLITIVLDRPGQ